MKYKFQNLGSTSIGFNNLYQPKDPIPETMNAVIGLEDGTILHDTGFGTECKVSGELVVTTQFNTNDSTIEGFENPDLDVLSVQYHHEAHQGPRDTEMWFFRVARKCG